MLKVRFAGFAGDEGRPRPPTGAPRRRPPRYFVDLPPVCRWEPPADPAAVLGRAAPTGSPRQQAWAGKIRAAVLPRVLDALDDLLFVRGEEDLRDVGREAVLGLLGRADAKTWIDWHVEGKRDIDMLAIAAWRRCREQAFYWQALPEALAWRQALDETSEPSVAGDARAALDRAREAGYLVVESSLDSAETPYREWCRERGLPVIIADRNGRYAQFSYPANRAGHAQVLAILSIRSGGALTPIERAGLEAACRVCISADGRLGDVSLSWNLVFAIAPRGLAVPLAARLRQVLGSRFEERDHIDP